MMRWGAVLLAVASLPLDAAQEWTYAASDHFEVYTTGGVKRAREALEHFERVHAFFGEVVQLTPKSSTRTRLIIFSNEKEFEPYKAREVAFAYYVPGPGQDYIVMQSFGDQANVVVVHEYVHLLAEHSGASFPPWLNEGMAEFYSTLSPTGGKMSVGRVPEGHLRYLATGVPLFPLDRLFVVEDDSDEYNAKEHVGVFYSESWALTHMLLMDDRYRATGPQFISAISSGAEPVQALQQFFGKSAEDVLKDLKSYIRGDRFNAAFFDYEFPQRSNDFEARVVTQFEADLAVANLLTDIRGKEDQAAQAFERLLAENPDHLELRESLAYFELRRDEPERALPHFARAVELGSEKASLYREYAVRLPMEDSERKQALLRQALALGDTDLTTRLTFARLLLASDRPVQALAALNVVIRLRREQAFPYFQLMASAAVSAKRWEDARKAAARAGDYARTPEEVGFAARLVKFVDDASAYESRFSGESGDSRASLSRLDSAPQPKLVRAAPQPPSLDSISGEFRERMNMLSVKGEIKSMECSGPEPLFVVAADDGTTRRLIIDEPDRVVLTGAGSVTMDFQCGPQGKAAKIGFLLPENDGHADGRIRTIEFLGN